jgi:hypothetical protein
MAQEMRKYAGFLVNNMTGKNVPLRSCNIRPTIIDQIATYDIDQYYFNDENTPMETLFTFPTPADTSVYSFEAKNDEGVVIVAKIKEKSLAKQEYNAAIINGDTAYYMQRETGDVFSVAIGNLPPQKGVEIRIKCVIELSNEENCNFVRFNLPLTIMPRYISDDVSDDASDYASEEEELDVSEQKELDVSEQKELDVSEQKELDVSEQKELVVSEQKELDVSEQKELVVSEQEEVKHNKNNKIGEFRNPPKVDEKPFSMSIEGDIISHDGIVSLNSKTHKIKFSKMLETSLHFEIQDLEKLDRDIVLTLERKKPTSHVITQEFKGDLIDEKYRHCTLINVVPDFGSLKPVNVNDVNYVIVLDKSGSMHGSSIENCKIAAQRFVALLPMGCSFDIYTFNHGYQKFSGEFTDNKSKKIAASKWIQEIEADGGTEILPVLKEVYSSFRTTEKKNVFSGVIVILSDGGVSNTTEIIRLVKQNPNVSVFSIGIGDSVSQELIKGLATHGNGFAEFIGSCDKNIVEKVQSQLKKSQDTLRKYQNDYTLEVKLEKGNNRFVPEKLPTLYDNTNNTIFLFSEFRPESVKYIDNRLPSQGERINDVESKIQELLPVIIADDSRYAIHRMAGVKLLNHLQTENFPKKRGSKIDDLKVDGLKVDGLKVDGLKVDDLKDDKNNTDEIIQISTDLNILSKHTAFIGVEERKDKVTGEMVLREIPLQKTKPKSYEGEGYPGVFFKKGRGIKEGSAALESCMMPDETDSSESLTGYLQSTDSIKRSSLSFTDRAKNAFKSLSFGSLFGGASKNNLSYIKNSTTGHTFTTEHTLTTGHALNKQKTPQEVEVKYVVKVSLSELCVSLGNMLSSIDNKSLIDVLKLTDVVLKVGDIIELTLQKDSNINGLYEIISIGSSDEPWVLSIVS